MERKLAVRYFCFAFAGAFFLLSLMVMAAVLWSHPYQKPQLPQTNGSVYLPAPEDAITALIVGIPKEEQVPQTYMVVGFRPKQGQIPLVTLSGNTQVTYRGKPQTLQDVYSYGGVAAIKIALNESFGIMTDRYAQIPADGFVKIVNLIGVTGYRLDQTLKYTQGSITVTLGQGIQQIDGKKAYYLATYPDKSEMSRCHTVSSLAQDAINQHMDLIISPLAQRLFNSVINLMDTDITVYDYEERHRAAEFLSQLKPNPAVAVYPQAAFDNETKTYKLTEEGQQTIRRIFGQDNPDVPPENQSLQTTSGLQPNLQALTPNIFP